MTTAAVANHQAKITRKLHELTVESEIVRSLADHLEVMPTVSNIPAPGETGHKGHTAVLHFSAPSYDPDGTWDPVAIMDGIEAAGYSVLPACLPKWGQWRVSFEAADAPNGQPLVPSTKDKLTDLNSCGPFSIVTSSYTGIEFQYFVTDDTGLTYCIHIDTPRLPVRVHGTRKATGDSWHYSHVYTNSPARWPRCAVGTDTYGKQTQGIDSRIYFMPRESPGEKSAGLFYTMLLMGCE